MSTLEHLRAGTVLLVLAAIVVVAVALWLINMLLLDSNARRRRIARRLLAMAVEAGEAKPGERGPIVRRVLHEVQSAYRFTSCYSAWVASRLAVDYPEDTEGAAQVLGRLLRNSDPFRRHAGAQALYELGERAESQVEEMLRAADQLANESAGEIVRRLLNRLRGEGPSARA